MCRRFLFLHTDRKAVLAQNSKRSRKSKDFRGIVLLLRPLSGVLSLTLVLIAFFVIEGVASIMFAQLSGRWGWMLASGIIDLILATIILAGLPGTAAWAIGLLVGINMVFGGSALIAMALHAREIDPRSATPAH